MNVTLNYNLKQLNSQPQLSIHAGNLLVTPYEIEQLLEVRLQQKINEHGELYLKGLLAERKKGGNAKDTNDKNINENATNGKTSNEETPFEASHITLSAIDASGENFVLFQGVARSVKILTEGEVRHLEMTALSYSSLMDAEKKSRSFQDKKKTYTKIAAQVTAAYPGGDVIDAASKGEATGKFIIQHQETDWEFLKRLASRFHTGLVCDVRYDEPKYFFGVPENQELELDGNSDYFVVMDLDRYNSLSKNGAAELKEKDFIGYEAETGRIARIGDNVRFRGQLLQVYEITSLLYQEHFISRLKLMPKKGLTQPYRPNTNLVGASISGQIIESKNNLVKMSLDIDKNHDPGEHCLFPYSTIYSSRDGSGWYCMPETGDRARLYFPNAEDDQAFALSSVHEPVDPVLMQQSKGQENGSLTSGSGGSSDGSSGSGEGSLLNTVGAGNNAGGNADVVVAGGGAGSAGGTGGAGGYSGMRDDPQVKSLTYGSKEIRLTPDGVYIIASNAMIKLTDDGIHITCENDISIKSEQNISLYAEEDVSIVGVAGVEIMSETAVAVLEDDVQIIGQEVKAN